MKEYSLYRPDGQCGLSLPGASLIEAVENNFSRIAEEAGIGNAAGYQLEKVWMEYDRSALGGKGGVMLHIQSHGSDGLVKYDPRNDDAREATVVIYASFEDCPQRYDFPLEEVPPFDPFSDDPNASFGQILGMLSGLIDTLAASYCAAPYSDRPCMGITVKFANILTANPDHFLVLARDGFLRLRPVKNEETARILARIDRLFDTALSFPKKVNVADSFNIFYYKTFDYFERLQKNTAVRYYRKKAGYTQTELANKMGISLRQLQRYEKPNSALGNASYNFVCALADTLHVRPSQLVEDGLTVLLKKE